VGAGSSTGADAAPARLRDGGSRIGRKLIGHPIRKMLQESVSSSS
jgi:hypothetical protein